MKIIFITIISCFFLVATLFGQSAERDVIASAGGSGLTGAYFVSWTLGETFTSSYIGGEFSVLEGYQQPGDLFTDVELVEKIVSYKFFPNPTSGDAILELDMPVNTNLQFEILDLSGKIVQKMEREIQEGKYSEQFNLHDLSTGNYFLKIMDKNLEELKTIKFQKIR